MLVTAAETDRLTLRPLAADDGPFVVALLKRGLVRFGSAEKPDPPPPMISGVSSTHSAVRWVDE